MRKPLESYAEMWYKILHTLESYVGIKTARKIQPHAGIEIFVRSRATTATYPLSSHLYH